MIDIHNSMKFLPSSFPPIYGKSSRGNRVRIRNWEKERERKKERNRESGHGMQMLRTVLSFPLFAPLTRLIFARRVPPSRFYRGPETVHRHCRWYAERIESKGQKGGEAGAIRAWKTFLADDSITCPATASPSKPSLSFSLSLLSFFIPII